MILGPSYSQIGGAAWVVLAFVVRPTSLTGGLAWALACAIPPVFPRGRGGNWLPLLTELLSSLLLL